MCDYKKLGIACADSQNAIDGMLKLKEAAEDCKTISDYAVFMRDTLKLDAEEATDGIILHLHKEKCSCCHPEYIAEHGERLCECTKAHEEYTWSVFFGKPVQVEIVESFLRGGRDCVIKMRV